MHRIGIILALLVLWVVPAVAQPCPPVGGSPCTTNWVVLNSLTAGTLGTTGNAAIGGTLGVTGAATFNAPITISGSNPIIMSDGTHTGSVVLNFASVNAMLAYQPTNVGANMVTAQIAGRSSANDGGAATYVWAASSALSANDPFIFAPNSPWVGNGRWILQLPPGGLNPKVRGLACNGTSDDSAGLSNLLAVAGTVYGNFVVTIAPGVSCYIGTAVSVTVARTQEIRGSGNPMQATNGPAPLSLSGLIVDPAATINLGGTLRNLFISSKGLAPLPANMEAVQAGLNAWAAAGSIAVTAQNDDATLENVEIVGFNKGFYSSGRQRTYMHNVHIDAINGVEITASADTIMLSHLSMFPYWSANLAGHSDVTAASISAAGSGGTPGAAVLTMTASGNTCGTLPQLNVTISGGGAVSAVNSVADVGDCTVIGGPNPIAFTGAGLSGATFTVTLGGYRSGIGLYLHDQVDGGQVHNLAVEGGRIGVKLSNVWEVAIDQASLEAGSTNAAGNIGDTSAIGLDTENCVSEARLSNIYASADLGTAAYFNHNGTSCGSGADRSVVVSNLSLSTPATWHNQQALYVGTGSRGVVSGLSIGAPGFVAGFSAVFAANTAEWDIHGVNLLTSDGATTPWYTIDPTSSPVVSIISRPRIVSKNSGAALTALCNDHILVNDTTAPTITMPATCPLGQDVWIKDIGGQAAAHNITVSMPGGSTLDGAASQTMAANFKGWVASYNGVAAALFGGSP